jgi:hypothetical protein
VRVRVSCGVENYLMAEPLGLDTYSSLVIVVRGGHKGSYNGVPGPAPTPQEKNVGYQVCTSGWTRSVRFAPEKVKVRATPMAPIASKRSAQRRPKR